MTGPNLERSGKNTTTLLIVLILGLGILLPASMPLRQANADPVETCIYIDPQTAIKGEEVTIRGYLSYAICPFSNFDANLNGKEISITLSDQAHNLADVDLGAVLTESDYGDFFVTFTAPSDAAYWKVTAEFAGDGSFLQSTGEGAFATVEPDALVVTAGDGQFHNNVDLPLADLGFAFDASLNLQYVPDDYLGNLINMTVSQCTSLDTDEQSRYLPLSFDTPENNGNICLEIFPGPLQQINNHPDIHVDISYAGIEDLPDGYGENNIDLFYQNVTTGEITEITANRDVDAQEISGTVSDIGRFIVGIGLHGEPPEGAIRQHVLVGDDQQVMFRNVTDTTNATATVSISPDEITIGEPVTVTINYTNGNLDVNAIDELPVKINSTSSNPDYVTITVTETSENSGIFTGDLTLTNETTSGNSLYTSENDTFTFNLPYRDPFDARFKAVFDGVSEAGVIELSDYKLTENELNNLLANQPFDPVVELANITLVDAVLDENDGKVNVTMSYANALLGTHDPSTLKIYYRAPGAGFIWENWDTVGTPVPTLDTDNKLVSATFDTTESGIFALAFDPGIGGGAGGGLGKPGIGVVVDFVASFRHSEGGGGDGGEDDGGSDDGGSGNNGSGADSPSSHTNHGGGTNTVVIVNNQQQTTVTTFPESYFEEHPLEKVEISNAAFLDAAGTSVSSGNVGRQISIASTFTSHQQAPQHYSFIVLITDEDGFAIDISWQEGMAETGQTVGLSSSWMPQDGGNYTVKIFVWDGMDNPSPLSDVTINNISIGS